MQLPGALILAVGVIAALVGAPAPLALVMGIGVALAQREPLPAVWRPWTSRVLQLGVVALGAGMDLERVLSAGMRGAATTAATLTLTLLVAHLLGRALGVARDTSLLVGVGTAICGGSAIAAVASVIKPEPHETSIALAIVFLLNALALVVFPPIGHALSLSEHAFGVWCALAIHDTSSVVGAAMSFGPQALEIATTTKLARALWIVPVTVALAVAKSGGDRRELRNIKWPWFIAGFLAAAAACTWITPLAPLAPTIALIGRRLLVLALYLVGLGLSRAALRTLGGRALAQGVILWVLVTVASIPLARAGGLLSLFDG